MDDIINGMRNWTIDDNEIRFFTYADFDSWLKQKDPARHMLIKERCKKLPFTDEDGDVVGDDSTHYFICGMVTLFTLAYDCGYDFRTIADNKSKRGVACRHRQRHHGRGSRQHQLQQIHKSA